MLLSRILKCDIIHFVLNRLELLDYKSRDMTAHKQGKAYEKPFNHTLSLSVSYTLTDFKAEKVSICLGLALASSLVVPAER